MERCTWWCNPQAEPNAPLQLVAFPESTYPCRPHPHHFSTPKLTSVTHFSLLPYIPFDPSLLWFPAFRRSPHQLQPTVDLDRMPSNVYGNRALSSRRTPPYRVPSRQSHLSPIARHPSSLSDRSFHCSRPLPSIITCMRIVV